MNQTNNQMNKTTKKNSTTLSTNLTSQENIEREILRKIFSGDDKFHSQIMPLIDSKMFTNKFYRDIFATAQELFETQGSFDDLLVLEKCKINYMEKPQILAELNDISAECCCRANFKFYVRLLVDNYLNRLYEVSKNKEDFINVSNEEKKYKYSNNVTPLYQDAQFRMLDYEDSKMKAIFTGYEDIDDRMGCLLGGDFIILAGATSMGKTCMMLNLINNISLSKKVLLFSLEMTKERLQNRLICANLGLEVAGFRKFNFTKEQINKFIDYAKNEFPKYNILISDEFNIDTKKIRETIAKNKDVDIVFIDYLGLINGDSAKTSYEKYGDISREIKLIAKEMDKPIVALHQLSRSNKDRKDKRPKLSDLRDSGKIEQDADVVWFVYRPFYYDATKSNDLMQFIIAKNRDGETHVTIDLCYNPSRQKITNRIDTDKF